MATNLTPSTSTALDPSEPRIESRSADQETHASHPAGSRRRATTTEREAILVSLHEERRRITQAKRLGHATDSDEEYLAELKDYIDEFQSIEAAAEQQQTSEVWTRFEALASTLLEAQAEIARQSKKK
jgi:hypothetical protein